MSATWYRTRAEGRHLADVLTRPGRRKPVVVVSTRWGETRPEVDVDTLSRELADDATVAIVETGDATWAMKDVMPERTHVWGGACRVYPTDPRWMDDVRCAPLRTVFSAADADTVTHDLIGDAKDCLHLPESPFAALRDTVGDQPAAPGQAPTFLAPAADADTHARPNPHDPRAELRRLHAAHADHIRTLEQQHRDEVREIAVKLAAAEAKLRDRAARTGGGKKRRGERPAAEPTADHYRPEMFPTPDAAIRYAVLATWVDRVPACDKVDWPLPKRWRIEDGFAESLTRLDRGQLQKAFKCVVDVLTGRAKELDSRELHANDDGPGGLAIRADGAVGYRASIERGTASARRLHWWRSPDGTIELSHVVLHDQLTA